MTMTTQSARARMLMSSVHRAATVFWNGVSALLVTAVFLFAVLAFVIPVGHHVWTYWHSAATSWQAPAPAKAAQKR